MLVDVIGKAILVIENLIGFLIVVVIRLGHVCAGNPRQGGPISC
jgi:hypothetical protein